MDLADAHTDPSGGVVLWNPKYLYNLGGTVRAAACFGSDFVLWTGSRIELDTERLPRELRMKEYASVKVTHTSSRPFDLVPKGFVPVCVEILPTAESLTHFQHPDRAVYVFGPEDGEVPQVIRRFCHRFVSIPSDHCLNLSAAVNVVLAHRRMQRSNHVSIRLQERLK